MRTFKQGGIVSHSFEGQNCKFHSRGGECVTILLFPFESP